METILSVISQEHQQGTSSDLQNMPLQQSSNISLSINCTYYQ